MKVSQCERKEEEEEEAWKLASVNAKKEKKLEIWLVWT
jgi:hypothetical protein